MGEGTEETISQRSETTRRVGDLQEAPYGWSAEWGGESEHLRGEPYCAGPCELSPVKQPLKGFEERSDLIR